MHGLRESKTGFDFAIGALNLPACLPLDEWAPVHCHWKLRARREVAQGMGHKDQTPEIVLR